MPARHAEAPQTAQPAVLLAGVLLMLLAIVSICLLAVAAAGSSIDPADGTHVVSTPTIALTPDDPGAASPVPVQVLDR